MPSIFGYASESADSISGSVVEQVTSYNNAGLLEGAMEAHQDAEEAGNTLDKLVDGEDKLDELAEVVTESFDKGGLSKEGLQYLRIAFRNIVGKGIADKRTPAMESADITHPIQLTAIALEGINDTIKQFWDAIKNQAVKFWNSTKQWYTKTFDVANKIIARAKSLEEKSGSLSTSPTENTLELSNSNLITVNYQVKDPSSLITAFGALKNLVDTGLDNITKENQANKSDSIINISRKLLTKVRNGQQQAANNVVLSPDDRKTILATFSPNVNTTYEALIKMANTEITDAEIKKKMAITPPLNIKAGPILPGDRRLYSISSTADPSSQVGDSDFVQNTIEYFKSTRFIIAEATAKPREVESEQTVKTLNASQLQQIASISQDIGEVILKYKMEFEARDKYLNSVVKGFDQIFKDLDGSEVKNVSDNQQQQQPAQQNQQQTNTNVNQNGGGNGQAPTTSQADGSDADTNNMKPVESVDKDIRKLANAILQTFRKEISLSGSIVNQAIKTTNVFLTYGERSLAQYGG